MSQVTSKDGTAIAYERVGQGPPLILVDGALCSRTFGPMPKLAPLLDPGAGLCLSRPAPRPGVRYGTEQLERLLEASAGLMALPSPKILIMRLLSSER